MSHHAAHGISFELPPGWNGQIYRRRDVGDMPGRPGAAGAKGRVDVEESGAILRAATVPIDFEDGDFGGGIVERLGALNAFFVLFEYTVDENLTPGEGLFASRRVPWPLEPARFSRRTLHVALPGHAGFQHFFTAAGRPFCLYAVLGNARRRRAGVARVNSILATVRIGPSQ